MGMRKLERADEALYLEMAAEFYDSPAVLHPVPANYFRLAFEEMMRSDIYMKGYLLMDEKGEAAGYALISKMFSQETGGMAAWIEEVYVRQEHRGKGIGKGFFKEIGRLNPEITCFRLEVEKENARAIELYHRTGFEEITYCQMRKILPE